MSTYYSRTDELQLFFRELYIDVFTTTAMPTSAIVYKIT